MRLSKGGRVHNPQPDLHSTSYFAALPPPGDAGARHTVKIFHNRLVEKESSLQTTRVDLDPAVERKRPAPEPAAREVPASQPSPSFFLNDNEISHRTINMRYVINHQKIVFWKLSL